MAASFKDFNIKPSTGRLKGDKIKISKILNIEILVDCYIIEKSKIEGWDMCLHLQLELNGEKKVVFTSGKELIRMIDQVPKDGFPFKTKITTDGDQFIFT